MRSVTYGLIGALITGMSVAPQSAKAQAVVGYATPAYYYVAYPGYAYRYYYYPASYVLIPAATVAYPQPTVTVAASAERNCSGGCETAIARAGSH